MNAISTPIDAAAPLAQRTGLIVVAAMLFVTYEHSGLGAPAALAPSPSLGVPHALH